MEHWTMSGVIVGECNCDWGCPCNFDAPPTHGNCDGTYSYLVKEGRYGDTSLDGVAFLYSGSSPGAVHEGNLTSVLVIDESTSGEQREALETLWKSGESGLPFDIWNTVTSKWLDTIYAPIEFEPAGINTKIRAGGGEIYDAAISRIKNPVTGDEEEIYLDKVTGFTSTRTELGMSLQSVFSAGGLEFNNTGKYAEFAEFSYSGP